MITNRQVNGKFMHALCSRMIIGDCTVSLQTRERSYLFPLYLHTESDKKDLFSYKKEIKKQPNINPEMLLSFCDVYKKEPIPEEMFYYSYGVLYSNIYRTKYADFLRSDFPKIPFTEDYKLFCKMGEYGKELVGLHLLKSNELERPTAKFQGKGDNKIEKVKYEQVKVHINNDQYFEGISPEVWQYQIGGYQVCDKWLKDRKGRALSLDEIRHYCQVVTSIQKTIEIQKRIDDLYPEIEKKTIEFIIPKKE